MRNSSVLIEASGARGDLVSAGEYVEEGSNAYPERLRKGYRVQIDNTPGELMLEHPKLTGEQTNLTMNI
ncbi:hypothetical protein BPOR_0638g00010 [Botrytis porri]|uniref:Uncharacterized protein n=1 Tax=Botrytis porri TaxID=87229 RepID=A0A4Z1KBD0_9HELO|nr:hypothetical protein BPOR_0638g00010 [Botrytis porri]